MARALQEGPLPNSMDKGEADGKPWVMDIKSESVGTLLKFEGTGQCRVAGACNSVNGCANE